MGLGVGGGETWGNRNLCTPAEEAQTGSHSGTQSGGTYEMKLEWHSDSPPPLPAQDPKQRDTPTGHAGTETGWAYP